MTELIHRLDVPFSVGFDYRLRFTRDVLGHEQGVLAEVLDPGDAPYARVQFWVDSNLMEARPELRQRINEFCRCNRGRVVRAGSIQVVPGGEDLKNDIHLLEPILKAFHAANLDRRSYVVVIGGGAALDAVGFAAAIAHRGLRLVRLPTTTMGQGDSGIGVKNAVNLFNKKNWLGTFAVPWAVINDAELLATLSQRDFISGFSEAVKVSLLKDPSLFEHLCQSASRIRQRDMDVVAPVLRRSAELHLAHITQGGDPFELQEARPLDFGHWSAHKLEAMSDFELRHGEAVALGVAVDTVYSSLALGLPAADAQRVLACLVELGFTLDSTQLRDTEVLFGGLEEFRQHLGGRLTLTMLEAIGRPVDVHEVDRAKMTEAIRRVSEYSNAECGVRNAE
jgi:3-dehydroquinate synthase